MSATGTTAHLGSRSSLPLLGHRLPRTPGGGLCPHTDPFSPLGVALPSSRKLLMVPSDFSPFSRVIFQLLLPPRHAGLGALLSPPLFPTTCLRGKPQDLFCVFLFSSFFRSMVDVQRCVNFCCTAECFSHTCMCSLLIFVAVYGFITGL